MMDIEDLCGSSPRPNVCANVQYSPNSASWYEHPYDFLIIGAGVTGCSIARELSKYEAKVLVLDKAYDVAQGASKANSGIVHGGYDDKHGTLKSKLSHRGNQLFPILNEQLHFGFLKTGSMVLAFTEEERAILEKVLQNGIKNGLKEHLRIIEREEVLKMEPHVNPKVHSALYCSCAGITSPYEYTIALIENAVDNGVELILNNEVTHIERTEDDYYVVSTDKQFFKSRWVINCAGLYADRIASFVGANDFKIIPRKGEYIVLNKNQGHLANAVLFHVPNEKFGKGVLVSRTYWGNLLLGPTARDIEDPTKEENPALKLKSNKEVMSFLVHASRELVPGFDASQAITSFSGLRARTNRTDWIIEESKKAPFFINCAGIDSPGLTSSPAVALYTVDEIIKKKENLTPKSNFNPNRPPIIISKNLETFDGSIDDPDPKKNIICRCELITEAEIVDAIHRGIPVTCVDSVKKRTRAGMGKCQGTFCGERVVKILSRETGIPAKFIPRFSSGSSILPHKVVTDEDKDLLSKL
eukprot:TRINITY_DN6098_c0_g1_i1.p1 TRINITY_DN6098_c0_g1~~TRINITY_DN6098_c0_g1_i1.p1  ORF type:complete len:528 (+),score=95.99 TRINITY_DN6098_c0_g1_i1:68-1651(+)